MRAAAASTWCCDTPYRPSGPTTYSSGLAAVAGLEISGAPLLTRLAQGPLDAETGTVGDPLHPRE